MDKTSIIEKVYFDPAGFGSISETLKDAQKYDKPTPKPSKDETTQGRVELI